MKTTFLIKIKILIISPLVLHYSTSRCEINDFFYFTIIPYIAFFLLRRKRSVSFSPVLGPVIEVLLCAREPFYNLPWVRSLKLLSRIAQATTILCNFNCIIKITRSRNIIFVYLPPGSTQVLK